MNDRPLVVGVGGTTRVGSSSERALRAALEAAEGLGAETVEFVADDLDLPMYAPERPERSEKALRLVDAIRRCDGLIVCSPGYHGGFSGLVKNAIDYIEDLREDERPYLDGRAVGFIVPAYGWQATTTTLVSLRQVAHALRGWPTPLGVVINSADPIWNSEGVLVDERVATSLSLLAGQVVEFARMRAALVAG
jgi:FMN reductase